MQEEAVTAQRVGEKGYGPKSLRATLAQLIARDRASGSVLHASSKFPREEFPFNGLKVLTAGMIWGLHSCRQVRVAGGEPCPCR